MMRVLVVDDNEANRYLLRVLLQGEGWTVMEASDGIQALAAARSTPPDLAVSDLLMPAMDGFTLLRRWRADERLRSVPFLVYTATYTEPRDERLARALGADAFIIKPAEPEVFVATARELVAAGARGDLPSARARAAGEGDLIESYNEVLVGKLEQKAAQLERSIGELRSEIARREQVEARLRESEERYRATFEQAAAGLVHVATSGAFLRVNDEFCRMTGYDREELLTRTFAELAVAAVPGAADAAGREPLAAARGGDATEWSLRRKDGGTCWCNVVSTLVRSPAAEPGYYIAVVVDQTERKALEEQLRRAQKLEALGRLAGGVAHDFNNLLTVISGCAELLGARVGLDDSDREVVEAIREAGERAAGLTRQLLGFSRQTPLQPRVLDLNAVATETGKLLARMIGTDVELVLALDPALGRVRVDRGQLDQVLMNLAVNARDAMPDGGELTLETADVTLDEGFSAGHPGCRPGRYALLRVRDTGCGMTPEVQARLFEPFFTTKPAGKGTGLGLAMVFGIVQQSGGVIRVESAPGRGSTFEIYLPTSAEAATEVRGDVVADSPRGTETILLVEDEAGVRALATRILQSYGYRVVAAVDGADALAQLREHRGPLDLVLTDVRMPNVGGADVAAAARERFPALRVLFMSGFADGAAPHDGPLAADVAFIQKPYTARALAEKVRQVLDGNGRGAGAPSSASPPD